MSDIHASASSDSNGGPCLEVLKLAYGEICTSYHAIDDFRAKLLALLPIASGTGVILLLQEGSRPLDMRHVMAVGLFGFAVTTGLLFYELRGIQRCKELIKQGAQLEEQLRLRRGQFLTELDPLLGFVRATAAAYVVYAAVLVAWAYVALVGATGASWAQ